MLKSKGTIKYSDFFIQFFRPLLAKYIMLFMVVLINIGLQLYNPYLLRDFIDGAYSQKPYQYLILIAVGYTGVALSQQLVSLLITYVGETLGWKSTNSLRSKLASHYLKLGMVHQKKYTSGEIIERIDGDVNVLQGFFSNLFIELLGNILLIVGINGIMFFLDWRIGTLLAIFTVSALFLLSKARQVGIPYFQKLRATYGHFYGFITEYFVGLEDIRSNGSSPFVMKRFYSFLHKLLSASIAVKLSRYLIQSTSLLLFSIGNMISFIIGAYLLSTNQITMGTLFMIFNFTNLLVQPIESIRLQFEEWQKADASIHRVKEILDIQPMTFGHKELEHEVSASVEFENVIFRYEDNQIILNGIDFYLEPNTKLGLLGRTGSGKSTLTKLLLRFYDPTEGSVKIDGIDLRDISLRSLRKSVGIVTQDVKLFRSTLRNNLSVFDPSITDDRIHRLIEELALTKWYKSLPQGLDTPLLNNGIGVSAGEAQLISLMRVFLINPRVVILDEASSKLDPATEFLIHSATTRLLHNRTAIIITHRLATVEKTDKIMIVERGKIVEFGSRDALARDIHSQYHKLLITGGMEVFI